MIPLCPWRNAEFIALLHDQAILKNEEKSADEGYFPHLLPLKEGGEEIPSFALFSLLFPPTQSWFGLINEEFNCERIDVFLLFTSYCWKVLHSVIFFFLFSEINLPVLQIAFPNRKEAVFTQKRCAYPPTLWHEQMNDTIMFAIVFWTCWVALWSCWW